MTTENEKNIWGGMIKRGGVNEKPSTSKPNVVPEGQQPSTTNDQGKVTQPNIVNVTKTPTNP